MSRSIGARLDSRLLALLAPESCDALMGHAIATVNAEGRPHPALLHAGHLRQMLALAELGGVVLPPIPGFYLRPKTVARVLDRLGIPQDLVPEWTGGTHIQNRRFS